MANIQLLFLSSSYLNWHFLFLLELASYRPLSPPTTIPDYFDFALISSSLIDSFLNLDMMSLISLDLIIESATSPKILSYTQGK